MCFEFIPLVLVFPCFKLNIVTDLSVCLVSALVCCVTVLVTWASWPKSIIYPVLAQAYYSLGDLSNRHSFLLVSKAGKPKIQFLVRPASWLQVAVFLLHLYRAEGEEEGAEGGRERREAGREVEEGMSTLVSPFSSKDINPIMGAPPS